MSVNRVDKYLVDMPTGSCPQCERARQFYMAAHKEIAVAAVMRLEMRQSRATAIRLFWTSCLLLFATFCTALFIVFTR